MKNKLSRKHVLHIPLYCRIVGFEALLLCLGTIACGLWFCTATVYAYCFENDADLLISVLAMLIGLSMIGIGVYLARFILPNLMARVTVTDDAVIWSFLFRRIKLDLADIRYTDITNYKHEAIVPYIVIATVPIGDIPLDKLKRSDTVIFFQLYKRNVPILHEAIPKPYNQILNKPLYMMSKGGA